MDGPKKIILKPGKEVSLKRRHPWIFSGAVARIPTSIHEGDIVEVYDSQGEFLATGHYQIGSIAVRVLSFEKEPVDQDFWIRRISKAYALRRLIGLTEDPSTNVFRLVHGEGDNLPGLIVDYYNGIAVVQFHSIGMYLARAFVVVALREVLKEKLTTIYSKSSQTLPFKGPVTPCDELLWGKEVSSTEVREYGNTFMVDWTIGQKTGFFIDQRENRRLVQQYSGGRKVLNMFGYTGGFSVYALRGQASVVHTVDISEQATGLAVKNVKINFGENVPHEAFVADAFEYLKNPPLQYDMIILDPPAFAKHTGALSNALQAYKRLNHKAIVQLAPGGILFTFSCSQVVSKEDFRKAVFAAAVSSKRKVAILHQLTQPADHPVSLFHPEGEYLKGLVLLVE